MPCALSARRAQILDSSKACEDVGVRSRREKGLDGARRVGVGSQPGLQAGSGLNFFPLKRRAPFPERKRVSGSVSKEASRPPGVVGQSFVCTDKRSQIVVWKLHANIFVYINKGLSITKLP